MDQAKISTWELICTTTLITFTPLLVTLPRSAGETFGTAAVLHAVYIAIVITLFFLAVFKLYKNLEDKDIFDLAELVGGKALKTFTGILILFYMTIISFLTINEFSEDVKNVLFANTNVQNVSIVFILGVFIAAYFGIKGIFRISTLIFPILVVSVIAILFSVSHEINILNLAPVLRNRSA